MKKDILRTIRHTLFSLNGLIVLLCIVTLANIDAARPQRGELEEGIGFVPGEYTACDLQVKDTVKNEWIGIGMDKSEVDRRLGSAEKQSIRGEDYNGLHVFYRDGKVAALTILAGDNARRGAGLAAGLKDVQALYGEQKAEELHGSFSTTFVGEMKGDRLAPADVSHSFRNGGDLTTVYVISFSYFDNARKGVSGIYISDGAYAYTGK